MPRRSPYRIDLSEEERSILESLARSYTLPYWQVTRAQMVLLAAEGLRNDQIAARLNCRREVVSRWRKRFFETRLAGLEDRPRRGRPPTFPPSRPR
jgi:Winged helix-turn helix